MTGYCGYRSRLTISSSAKLSLLGSDCEFDPLRFRTSPFDVHVGHDAQVMQFTNGIDHHRRHARLLARNSAPGNPACGLVRIGGSGLRLESMSSAKGARENGGEDRAPNPVFVFLSPTRNP